MSALAQLTRRTREKRNAQAIAKQRCVVIVGACVRELSLGETTRRGYRASDILTCIHGNSYTTKCTKCRRSVEDAAHALAKLKQMLSII